MTTHDLGRVLSPDPRRVPGPPPGPAQVEDDLGALFESSPARPVHTSAAAEVGFLAGLVSAVIAPFSLTLALCLGLAAIGLVSSVIGLARASRARTSGSLLASMGLVLSLVSLAVVGLRYAGIDTAVGDAFVPTLADWLTSLNGLVPRP